ncbi:MAG TPA: glycosyltransferase N-terminal domain-containing protein [Candidatus Acidoferrum sp.]|nr:glycosyltransferase N-terminal domain-containing protein [Candidatus Acidoferrum sp.]
MIPLYKFVSYILYFKLYAYGLIKIMQGDRLWRERLVMDKLESCELWLHAASVGEVRVVSYLIDRIASIDPKIRIHLTVMTRSGYETAMALTCRSLTVSFFQFDVPTLVRKKLDMLRPRMIVIAETELWPNLILEANDRNIPIVLVNGRMSERASKRYRFARSSFRTLLATYDQFFFKTKDDSDRFAEFGVTPDRSIVAGDMKFDAPLIERAPTKIHEIRAHLGVADGEFLFVAGSTRPGEEALLFQVYAALKSLHPRIRLVIAPRHLDRVGEILSLCTTSGLKPHRYQNNGGTNQEVPVESDAIVVVDQMGILNDLYLAGDLAFVGGTLVDLGGHNLLEPVWAGTPVLFGPSVANVRDAAEYVESNRYGARVESAEELQAKLADILAGRHSFAVKTASDLAHSATAVACDYILSRLHHA